MDRQRQPGRDQKRNHAVGDAAEIAGADAEHGADDAAHEADRQEHRDDREGRGQHRQTDFCRAFQRRNLVCLEAAVHFHTGVPHNVFPHHDGIVDQQADAQRQRHQRNHVDGEAEIAAITPKVPSKHHR